MSEQKNKNIFIKISQGFFKTDLGIFIFFVPLYLIWVLSSTASLLKNYNNLYLLILGITLTFIVLSYFYWQAYKDKQNKYKLWILTLFFVFFLGIFGLEINQRFDEKITANYHDSLPQIETSIDYFLAGKNPYQENYYGTPLEDYDLYRIIDVDGKDTTYHQLNPAFENYVYPPAQFILAAPFKLASEKIFGFYDHRFFILIFFILSLFVVYCLPKSDEKKLSLLIIYIFNPFFLGLLTYGYNDITAILPLLYSLYLLKKNNYYWASFFIAISILIKYNTVFYLPFFLLYIFIKKKYSFEFKSLLKFCRYLIPMIIPVLILLLPWIIWDSSALYHDTVYYLNHIYPIRSLGLSAYWVKLGIVQSPFEYHPFWIYQMIFLLLAVPPLIKKQFKNNDLHHIYLAGTIIMAGIYFFYRYFTSSQLILVIQNFLSALFI